ncbi:hypothetical protein WJR50_00940 [Catalinimonas sp. 4WD22]|uniref:hypothetical protein n=1 Tax=Catalinimonas locisalis TaxID=3133978 RepID=UPI003101983E
MNYVQEQQKRLMKEKLLCKAELTDKDFGDIIYSYQTASGNSMGSGKIMGILNFLKEGNSVTLFHEDGKTEKIKDKFDLANLIKSIDSLIDITSSRFFKEYF